MLRAGAYIKFREIPCVVVDVAANACVLSPDRSIRTFTFPLEYVEQWGWEHLGGPSA